MIGLNIPIHYEWTQKEIVIVAEFFDAIARVVEQGEEASLVRDHYKEFKTVVPSKSEEKQLFKEVDEQLGISCFKIIKQARETEGKIKG